MRFYRHIDLFDRMQGIKEIGEYEGDIPTDLTTYLSFFETLYIIIASKSLDLSIIDFAYRFRFFAGCNNPTMQKSELLPLGYQYPNITAFYNMWSDYIVSRHDHSQKVSSISNAIPLYEYDLHKNYAAYCFANNVGTPISIRFLNRYLQWLPLTMRLINESEIKACMELQDEAVGSIEDNDTNNIFEALTEEEMQKSLVDGVCVGLFDGAKLVAQINLLVNPDKHEDLTKDLPSGIVADNACTLDYVVVSPRVRGYAIQRTLLFASEFISLNYAKEGICAVVSPRNNHSIKNFLAMGFQIVATQAKYKSTRHYMWKSVSN